MKTKDLTRYARRCDITGAPMNSGYVINDGLMYISDEDTLIAWMESQGLNPEAEFETVDTSDEWFYYTEWETPSEDDEHYLSDGTYVEEK